MTFFAVRHALAASSVIVAVVLNIIEGILGLSGTVGGSNGPLTALFGLAILIPSIAVGIRRLHDTDRSGWWLLIALVPIIGAIVLIFFFVTEGQLFIDLEGKTIELNPGQGVTISKGVMHRPRAPKRTVMLMVETSEIQPVGD